MATQSVNASAGSSWLSEGTSIAFRYPRSVIGGAIFLMLAMLTMVAIQLATQFHFFRSGTLPSSTIFRWISFAFSLLSLLLLPLYAGYLKVIDDAECEFPTRARNVFIPYFKGDAWRLIAYGFALWAVQFALFGIVTVVMGNGFLTVRTHIDMNQSPLSSPNFWLTFAALLVIFPLLLGFLAISFGQLTLGKRGVFSAISDGIAGTLKNILPLLVLEAYVVLSWLVAGLGIGIASVVFGFIAKNIGVWIVPALLVPLYIAFAIFLFTSMFGVMYQIWSDVCWVDTSSNAEEID
jgi:hypothetical protein